MAFEVIESISEYFAASERLSPFEFARCDVTRIPLADVKAADEWVRVAIAHNKTAPVEFLATLADDPVVRVRSAVASVNRLTPELSERFARDPDFGIRGRLAGHKKVPETILRTLADDPHEWVREEARAKLKVA